MDQKLFDHFTSIYLEADGIFLLQLIGNNTTEHVATDLIQELWILHEKKYKNWTNQRKKSSIKVNSDDCESSTEAVYTLSEVGVRFQPIESDQI